MTNNSDAYQLKVSCSNCDFKGNINIPKQVVVENHPCPNCGNNKLRRHYEQPQRYIGDDDGFNL